MPIYTLQRQMREIGRIRIGAPRRGRGPGRRLETFRLTSATRSLIEAAAARYGGVVEPWESQWQVVTGTAALEIIIPPGESVSQWFELWREGGCVRRCNGRENVLTMGACECPADVAERVRLSKTGDACKATTRLKVILPALPDLGVWMLESHGYYAAVELAGAAEVLAIAAANGRLIPANLRLEQRQTKRPGEGAKGYTVPVIEIPTGRVADLDLPGVPRLGPGDDVRRIPAIPSTTLPPTSDLRGPEADGISTEELLAGLAELDVDVGMARLMAAETYGPGELTAGQRLDFITRLRAARDRAVTL